MSCNKRKREPEPEAGISRSDAVRMLWDNTHLGIGAVAGAMWLVDHTGGFPVTMLAMQAAAWVGYKQHTTAPFDSLAYFCREVMHDIVALEGLPAEEMRLLQHVGFALPSRGRLDCVYEVGTGLLEDAELDKGVALSLLLPELCNAMTDAQYSRCVVFAAAYKAGKTVEGLATAVVPKDYIFQHGMRIGRH